VDRLNSVRARRRRDAKPEFQVVHGDTVQKSALCARGGGVTSVDGVERRAAMLLVCPPAALRRATRLLPAFVPLIHIARLMPSMTSRKRRFDVRHMSHQ